MRFISITLIALVFTTSIVAADNQRKNIVMKRATPAAANAPFSEGVLVGDTLYVGGHLGIDPITGKPGATPEEEARLVLRDDAMLPRRFGTTNRYLGRAREHIGVVWLR